MARSRDAVDTIKGYYYQFDYFIFQLISLVNEEDTVTIEGIEDVDILEEKEMVAVQCKYYAKTEYNHSVIAKPIRLMLKDYVNRTPEKRKIRYKYTIKPAQTEKRCLNLNVFLTTCGKTDSCGGMSGGRRSRLRICLSLCYTFI